MSCFDQKIKNNLKNFYDRNTTILSIETTTFVSLKDQWYHCATGVLSAWLLYRNFVIYSGDWLSIKFLRKRFISKIVPVFRKYLSVSRWNLPGYFSISFRFPQVTEFGKSTANRRRSISQILFVSFTQPCDQRDRKIRMIRKSAARWRGRRARGYRKLIFRANLLYVPNIKM